MADIYLAISETPTVVTLTSAVLNSAVASSVTVVNTVTVALDANSLSALENVTVTVGAAITGTVTIGNSVTIGSLPAITGTVTANVPLSVDGYTGTTGIRVIGTGVDGTLRIQGIDPTNSQPANLEEGGAIPIYSLDNNALPVSISALPAGTNQIGSVTASISGTVPISISSVTVGNSVTIGSLPAISGTVTANVGNISSIIGGGYSDLFSLGDDANLYVQANVTNFPATQVISGTVTANTFALQGTAVTTSNFTSTTASTVLANYDATREVLTIFNEGAGNLHIAPGATCTTIAYQVRLAAGDYFEVPSHQTTITHSAVFASAGTARICQLS
jgi:hypothetical protein